MPIGSADALVNSLVLDGRDRQVQFEFNSS